MIEDPVDFGFLLKEDVGTLRVVIEHMASDIGSLLPQDHEYYPNLIEGEGRGFSFRVPARVHVPPRDYWQRIYQAVTGKLIFYNSCRRNGKFIYKASSSAEIDKVKIMGKNDDVPYIIVTASNSDDRIVFDYTSSMVKILKPTRT